MAPNALTTPTHAATVLQLHRADTRWAFSLQPSDTLSLPSKLDPTSLQPCFCPFFLFCLPSPFIDVTLPIIEWHDANDSNSFVKKYLVYSAVPTLPHLY